MKQIFFLLAIAASLHTNAQKIVANKGDLITITTTSDQDIDMSSMGMQLKNKITASATVQVKDAGKETAEAEYTLKAIKTTMNVMGQETTYDSNNPEDKDSEMAKAMGETVGKSIKAKIDKNNGKVTVEDADDLKEDDDNANPMSGFMSSLGSGDESSTISSAFFIIPAGKKVGDSWVDSTINADMKDVRHYTLKSLTGNVAVVGLNGTLNGNSSFETQGMQMDAKISTITKGDIVVDTKTSRVQKRTTSTDVSGTMEMMGQSIPISSKATGTVTYQ